ncbi:MAG: carbohydrate kinase [Planctomycetaceae bacterium]|nr:carbohydrate kinase [Planctomycetaceae bacterium]
MSADNPNPLRMPFVIGLGELLWDCFPAGRLPGGAPANVAFHVQQLGIPAAVATSVGTDPLGDELVAFLTAKGLRTDLVQRDPVHPTGTVTATPRPDGHTDYVFLEDCAWDHLRLADESRVAFTKANAIVFGTLAQRSAGNRKLYHGELHLRSDCLTVYDINLRPPFYEAAWIWQSIEMARVVKMNDDEARILAEMLSVPAASPVEVARRLLDRYFKLDLVCITRGGNGAIGVTRQETVEVPGVSVQVVDTVGAGDAFTAALIAFRLYEWPLETTLHYANRIGALVASRPGAMPDLRDEIAALKAEPRWIPFR